MVEVLAPTEGKILDPACGSGGMFVQTAHYIEKHKAQGKQMNLRAYGVEKTGATVRLAKMNLVLNNVRGTITHANSYYRDPYDSFGNFDYVMANPPFNVDGVELDQVKDQPRFNTYGVPQNKTKNKKKDAKETVPNGNYLWINQFATALNDTGRAALVMANSASDAGNSEKDIRVKLIESGIISQMVTLPSNMFTSVTLPATLWFFDKAKVKKDEILFIDARNIFTQIDRAHRKFSDEQIRNLGIITRLYEGKTEDFEALLADYRAKLEDAPEVSDDEDIMPKSYWQANIDWLTERFPTFLTTVALYTSYIDKQAGKVGTVSCKKKDVLNLSYESYIANRDQVLNGYRIARDFLLKYQYVFRQRDLPYTTQLIPLAAICAFLGKSKCNEANTISVLSKWYWCGILGEMYGGANETRYANDIEDVVDEVFGRPNPARTVNSAFFASTRLLTLQTRLSAAYKGIMALLYKEKCRDFMNDTTIDIVNSMLESPDIHHIFPEAYCVKQGIKRQRYNSIVNKTPILPATNRSIGGNAPSEYTKTILKKVNGLSEAELKDRIESHCVDYDALVRDDFDSYFVDRAKKLLGLIEKAMGKPVSDRDAEITIEQFGASLL